MIGSHNIFIQMTWLSRWVMVGPWNDSPMKSEDPPVLRWGLIRRYLPESRTRRATFTSRVQGYLHDMIHIEKPNRFNHISKGAQVVGQFLLEGQI